MTDPVNPPAFPRFIPDGHYNGSMDIEGMSLRDYFAGLALMGLLVHGNYGRQDVAEDSYKYADAMLTHRNTQPDTTTAQQVGMGIGGGK